MKDPYQIPTRLIATTPRGDIPVREERGARLLPVGPGESDSEADLRYEPYLKALRYLLLQKGCKKILGALASRLGRVVHLEEIAWIEIRTEKHGAAYHVARADLKAAENIVSFAVNVAVSDATRPLLERDFRLMRSLGQLYRGQCLPQVYFKGAGLYKERDKRSTWLHMFVAEWFRGYHEFHLHYDESESSLRVLLWDLDRGSRFLSRKKCVELYRQMARILTLYYDWNTFRQIYPWHHAAGDFVLKTEKGRVSLRLITVRNYGPMVDFRTKKSSAKLLALILFFMHLTVQMRLDRLDGVGDVVLAEDYCLEGVVVGFLEGLALGEEKLRRGIPSGGEILDLLRSFTKKDWVQMLEQYLDIYELSQEELHLIQDHAHAHVDKMQQVIGEFISTRLF
jgi:hypothetical protein